MDKIYDLIIIGAGPAGLTAGLYAGRSRLDTLLIDALSRFIRAVNDGELSLILNFIKEKFH